MRNHNVHQNSSESKFNLTLRTFRKSEHYNNSGRITTVSKRFFAQLEQTITDSKGRVDVQTRQQSLCFKIQTKQDLHKPAAIVLITIQQQLYLP